MPRLIDADALKDAMYQNGGCGICSMYVDDAPTIDAITVEWLKKQADYARSEWDYDTCEGIRIVLKAWQKEQEAQDA